MLSLTPRTIIAPVLLGALLSGNFCRPASSQCNDSDPLCSLQGVLILGEILSCTFDDTWRKVGSTTPNPDTISAVFITAILQDSDGAIYAAGGGTFLGNDAAIILKSTDGGASWFSEFLHQPSPGDPVLFTDMKMGPDGTIIALGNQNPDGTNDEAFLAIRPPLQSFSVTATYERQDTFVTSALVGALSPDLSFFAAGIGSNGAPDDAMLLSSPAPYQSLSPVVLLDDSGGNNIHFTALSALSTSDIRLAGIATDNSTIYEAIIGVAESGLYTETYRASFICCVGDESLHDPTDILVNGPSQYAMGISPGTSTADLRAQVWSIDTATGSSDSFVLNPDLPGATVRLQRHGNRTVAVSRIITVAAPTGTPQVDVSKDGGATFFRSMNPDTDGLIYNDSFDSSIQQSGTYSLNDASLLMPVSVDASVDAATPVFFYQLPCY